MMRVFLRWVCILQFTPNSRPEMKPFSGYNVNYEYHRCWLLPYMRTDPFPRRGNEERRRVPKVSHAYARTSDPVREVYTRVCRCHNNTLSSSRRSRTAQALLACIQLRRPPKPATWTWPPPPVRPPTSRPKFLSHLVISRPIPLSWASDDDDLVYADLMMIDGRWIALLAKGFMRSVVRSRGCWRRWRHHWRSTN